MVNSTTPHQPLLETGISVWTVWSTKFGLEGYSPSRMQLGNFWSSHLSCTKVSSNKCQGIQWTKVGLSGSQGKSILAKALVKKADAYFCLLMFGEPVWRHFLSCCITYPCVEIWCIFYKGKWREGSLFHQTCMCGYKVRRCSGRTTGEFSYWETGAALGQVTPWACDISPVGRFLE